MGHIVNVPGSDVNNGVINNNFGTKPWLSHGPLEVVSASLLLPGSGNITFICLCFRFCIFKLREGHLLLGFSEQPVQVKPLGERQKLLCCGCAKGVCAFVWFDLDFGVFLVRNFFYRHNTVCHIHPTSPREGPCA